MLLPFNYLDDTIAAISTPLGQGAIGIVRLSGKDALAIADQMFFSKKGRRVSDFKNFTTHYGQVIRDKADIIDEALLTVMRAPASYTKEDMVEISSHGGTVSLRAILTRALDLGARLAEPGEFTKRAFLNGRIDLAQAEAVLDIIQSKTEDFLRVSTNQLKGELSTELESIREVLMAVYVELEAILNFPEDVSGHIDVGADPCVGPLINGRPCLPADRFPSGTGRHGGLPLLDKIQDAKIRVGRLLNSSQQGRIMRDGIKVVICGRPNVGKSSLLNVLLKTPRAIVSAVAGTTRDTIEETAQIKGIPFQLVDTAGILEPRDFIEQEAIKRSRMYIQSADLVLLVLDSSAPLTREDRQLMNSVQDRNVIIVLNKSDLKLKLEPRELQQIFVSKKIVKVSALAKKGLSELEDTIVNSVWAGKAISSEGILVSNLRHVEALKKSLDALNAAEQALLSTSLEFVSEEIKHAVNFLDSITGRNIDTDLLDTIFSQFCIGK